MAPPDPKDFLQDWLRENINEEAYQSGDDTRARDLAEQCRQDAKAEGITAEQLEAAAQDMIGSGDSLEQVIRDAMEAATDAAVRRMSEDDD